MTDRRVIQCNYIEATGVAAAGARAYVARLNNGNGNDRIEVLVLSRGGHWVRKWENVARLGNFRVKTMPAEHPLYGAELADGDFPGDLMKRGCCDSHNRHCEPPGDLCCHDCTEAAHDMFPIRHGDGSRCVMEDV